MTVTRKAIFITGGGSGIGRAVAQKFAAEGWLVGLADVSEAGMAQTAALLPTGASASYRLDVRDREAWSVALAEFVSRAGGRLDVLFNNAGVAIGGPLVDCLIQEIDRAIDINLKGVLYGAHAAYPYLAVTPGSCLLNTASAAALYGSAGMSVYSATKFGVRAVTESLDGEWADAGIKVRSLMPGFIDTPLLQAPGSGASNVPIRDRVVAAGLEFTAVDVVAQAAWDAVHGARLHTLIGKTARKLAFVSRWVPGLMRRQAKGRFAGGK